jgi:U3 small nucleolar ribonucleoprotein protein IMP4
MNNGVIIAAPLTFLLLAYEIRLGTVDLTDADVEWQLASYTRTAAKRMVL